MAPEMAETIGLKALIWLTTNDDLRPVFMGATGVSGDDMRAGAEDPVFLASVLEFLTMDDAWVVAFCEAHEMAFDQPMRALAAMPGAEQVHWT